MNTPRVSHLRSAGLVAVREIMVRLRSVAFLVSSGILLLAVLAAIVIGNLTAANPDRIEVAIVDGLDLPAASALEDTADVVTVDDRAAAEAAVRSGEVDAALVPDPGPLGVAIVAEEDAPSELVPALSVSPPVELLDPAAVPGFLVYLVALGFGLVFFSAALTFGMTIAQSVVEEKQTRVVEILLAAIPTRVLLAGKIVGTSVLAVGQTALVVAIAIVGLTVTDQQDLLLGLGAALVWFVVFFLFGFVLLAAMFAATAAMVSRQEDIGSTTTPVMLLVMAPYFLVIFFNDNPTVMAIMSYVPFSAPVGMPVRLFLGDAAWWEPLLSLAILLVTTLAVIALGARIYDNSLLRLGARVPLLEALGRRA